MIGNGFILDKWATKTLQNMVTKKGVIPFGNVIGDGLQPTRTVQPIFRSIFYGKIDLKYIDNYTCMEWKAFGSYFISNDGKVKRYEKEKKLNIVKGYHQVGLSENGKVKNYLVHRLVLILFRGDCPNGYECDHIDRNPLNNRIDNLRWVSHYENNMNRCTTRTDIIETNPKKRVLIIKRESQKKNYVKRERKQGCIRVKNNRYEAIIIVNKIRHNKTFSTQEEAQSFIDSLK